MKHAGVDRMLQQQVECVDHDGEEEGEVDSPWRSPHTWSTGGRRLPLMRTCVDAVEVRMHTHLH